MNVHPKQSKKTKLTDPKFNRAPAAGSTVFNFEAGATLPEQIEEVTKVTSKIMPIKTDEPEEQTAVSKPAKAVKTPKAPKAAPESAPAATGALQPGEVSGRQPSASGRAS